MKKYTTEFKLEVVQSFMAGEGGAKLLARRWSVPEEKIRTWVSHYRLHGIDGFHVVTGLTDRHKTIPYFKSVLVSSDTWGRSRVIVLPVHFLAVSPKG